MIVQELMNEVDPNRVADAYILFDYHFSKDNFEQSLVEKYQHIEKVRHVISENIREFKACEIDSSKGAYTLFVMETPVDSYEDSWKKDLDGFLIYDKEILPVLDKDFRLFNDDGEVLINHYELDMEYMDVMAGYRVADSSIDLLGKEICAAYILSSMFFFGFMREEREKNLAKFFEDLEESVKQIERGKVVSHKLIFEEFEEELEKKMSEEERAYQKAKKDFEKAVEEIENKHRHKVFAEREQLYIDIIRKEYGQREHHTLSKV